MEQLLFRPFENEEKFCIRVYLIFFFDFHAKSAKSEVLYSVVFNFFFFLFSTQNAETPPPPPKLAKKSTLLVN